jgi:hypothetical protein
MKLSPLTIIIIGFSIFIATLGYGFVQHYMPNTQEAKFYQDWAEQLEAEGAKLPAAEKRKKKAEEMVTTKSLEWKAVIEAKTPNPDVNNRGVGLNVDAWQLTVDTKKFRDNIQRAVNAQLVKGGVKVVGAGPQIPMPSDSASDILASFYNYPAIAFPVVIMDLGQVTVEGTEARIMENVRSWKNMPHYLAVADGLSIAGTSPNLRGTYNVTLVAYIRGKEIYPTVPDGAAPAPSNPAPGGNRGPGTGGPRPGRPGGPGAPGGGFTPPTR